MLTRAYSLLNIKSVDNDRRIITGLATTPEPDRMGDVIEPLGVSFKNPLPLLLYHDSQKPVGQTRFKKPTKDGIEFEATLPKIDEPGILKDRVDEAWQSVKAGLIQGVSVGFRAIESAMMQTGGLHFLETEVVELSLVTIPANASASIHTIKSLDLAATGRHFPGDSGLPVVTALKDAPKMKTIPEQIQAFENTRAAKAGRMSELMTKASESGVTLDAAQSEEYDTIDTEIKSIDAHLTRLKGLEKINVIAATPVNGIKSVEDGNKVRDGVSVVSVKANVPKGTAFTRYVMAKVIGKNSIADAIMHVKSNRVWMDQTPEVVQMLEQKAVVNWGTVAEPAWAAPLAVATPINEFLELLRPATLIGKIAGLRQVPFNISMPAQTAGGTYGWVGEGAPKPVGQLQLATVTLGIAKAAGIIVISEELARNSTPSAEGVVRNDMINGMAQYLDTQFIDPTVAAVANVSPASITNLSNGYGSAGTSTTNARTDLQKAIQLMTANNYSVADLAFVMSESNAFALSIALTTNGVPIYPTLSAKGGSIFGVPVYTSQVAGNVVATIHPQSILFADEGGVNIDVSREAAVEMNTVPTSPVTAASVLVSLWQNNLVGLRAERFINWKRARTTAVVYTTQAYV